MLENEKKVTELKEEELKDVAGGARSVYVKQINGCPECGSHDFYDAATGGLGVTCANCGLEILYESSRPNYEGILEELKKMSK